MSDSAIVFAVLGGSLVLFVWGRWRYDVVALMALLAVTLTGVIEADRTFSGLGHPAVITVAAVLVVSRGLMNGGLVERIARRISFTSGKPTLQILVLMALVTVLSGFLSSVAAAALFVPVALRMARRSKTPPSALLMPVAFASLLGAQLTAIGSAPNIIITTLRAETGASEFRMFDFLPVGGVVALAGVALIALGGWRLIPKRKGRTTTADLLQLSGYLTEVRVPEGSSEIALGDLLERTEEDMSVLALVRSRRRIPTPDPDVEVKPRDILVIECEPQRLESVVADTGLELVGAGDPDDRLDADDMQLMEVTVTASSPLVGKTARSTRLRWRHGVNLLAISRDGDELSHRLGRNRLRSGDVLMLQGSEEDLHEAVTKLRFLPLVERDLRIGKPRRLVAALALFGGALAATATGTLSVEVAFAAAAVSMVVLGLLSLQEAYGAIDGSIVVLLGAMIPIGEALETSGGAALIADQVLRLASVAPPAATVAVLLVGTMFLSDLVNNAAAAVLMAPIALGVADGLGSSADPFLMAVAVGASCAFLTPIGHQSNTLVLVPGGYRFGDFWRLGLPLEVVVAVVAVPAILTFWPL